MHTILIGQPGRGNFVTKIFTVGTLVVILERYKFATSFIVGAWKPNVTIFSNTDRGGRYCTHHVTNNNITVIMILLIN